MRVDLNFDKIRLVLKFLTKSLRRQSVFQDNYFNNAFVCLAAFIESKQICLTLLLDPSY